MSALALRLRRFAIRAPRVASPVLRWVVLWGALALLAVFFATALPSFPTLAFFPLLATVGVLTIVRSPLLVFGALALTTGFYVTFTVEFPLPAGIYGLMAAAILALWVVALRERALGHTRDRVVLWPGLVLLVAVCLGSLGWVITSGHIWSSLSYYRITWWFLLAAVLVAIAPWPRFDQRFARVMLLAALASGSYAVLRWQIGATAGEAVFARRVGGNFTSYGTELRALGGVGDAHSLGLLMTSVLPFLFALSLGWRGPWRLLALATFGVCAVALVSSDVRSALIAAALGMGLVLTLFFAARPLGSGRLVAAFVGALLCVGAVAGTVAYKSEGRDESSQRFSGILNPSRDASLETRRVRWRDTWRDVKGSTTGHGIGTASSTGRKNQRFATSASEDVASSYLRVAYEQGLAWMVLLVAAMVAVLMRLVREALLQPDRERAILAIAGAGTLVAVAFQLNFESIYLEVGAILAGWLIVGLGLRSATLRPKATRDAGARPG